MNVSPVSPLFFSFLASSVLFSSVCVSFVSSPLLVFRSFGCRLGVARRRRRPVLRRELAACGFRVSGCPPASFPHPRAPPAGAVAPRWSAPPPSSGGAVVFRRVLLGLGGLRVCFRYPLRRLCQRLCCRDCALLCGAFSLNSCIFDLDLVGLFDPGMLQDQTLLPLVLSTAVPGVWLGPPGEQ